MTNNKNKKNPSYISLLGQKHAQFDRVCAQTAIFFIKKFAHIKKKRSFAPDFNGKDGKREKFTPYYIYKISCRYYKQKY